MNAKEFAAHVGEIVRDYLGRQLTPLVERVAALEARPPAERGADGPMGPPGPNGAEGAAGRDGAAGEAGAAGTPGRDGIDGKAGERGLDGTHGRDGLTGRDGTPGRDGKDGAAGLDGFGFDDLSVDFDGERTLTLRFTKGERVREFPLVVPWPLDRGVWRAGDAHARGDGVTHGGSWWIAQRDTQAKPGDGDDWRLATKKGRDGKDGQRGEKGDTGASGRNGRDLTQMTHDGTKYA